MTGRQTLIILITTMVAIAVARLVERAAGWLPGALTLVAIAIVGGLIGRYLTKRDLDRPEHPSR